MASSCEPGELAEGEGSARPPAGRYVQMAADSLPTSVSLSSGDVNYAFLVRASVTLGLSGLIFGYSLGVITGALAQMREEFGLDDLEEGLVVSLLSLGATCGGLVGGAVCDRVGRRRTVHVQNLLFTAGTLLICTAQRVAAVYAGRFVVGLGAAFSAVASLAYLAEVSPPHVRGIVTSAYEMLIVTGIEAAWSVDLGFSSVRGGWRAMFTAVLLPVVVQTLGMCGLPESPRWLFVQGRTAESLRALRAAYTSDAAAERELTRIAAEAAEAGVVLAGAELSSARRMGLAAALGATDAAPAAAQPENAPSGKLRIGGGTCLHACADTLARVRQWLGPLALASLVSFFAGFSAGNVIRNYAEQVLVDAGASTEEAATALVWLGAVKIGLTALTISLVDVIGRRPLLLTGAALGAAGVGVLVVHFASMADAGMTSGEGEGALADPARSSAPAQSPGVDLLVPIVGCGLVIGGYSLSYGPLAWVLFAELFPTELRGQLIGASAVLLNACIFGNMMMFEPLEASAGGTVAFAVYGSLSVLALVLFCWLLPETRGSSPELIRAALGARALCRTRHAAPQREASTRSGLSLSPIPEEGSFRQLSRLPTNPSTCASPASTRRRGQKGLEEAAPGGDDHDLGPRPAAVRARNGEYGDRAGPGLGGVEQQQIEMTEPADNEWQRSVPESRRATS